MDEYRFQVNLNWSRSQYFFVLNVGILVAGFGLLSASEIPLAAPMVVFAIGAATAVLAILASGTQHDYYKNIRDVKARLEERLPLGDLVLKTTRGMGGPRARLARITTFQKFILGLLLLTDMTGLATTVVRAARSEPAAKVALVVRVAGPSAAQSRAVPFVVSRAGRVVALSEPRPGRIVTLRLEPGRYRISTSAQKLCTDDVVVTSAPLQRVVVRCR